MLPERSQDTVPFELAAWLPADSPPLGQPGYWTADVVAVTNLGGVYRLAYFNGEDGGVWQRPAAFAGAEQVEFWRPWPDYE